MKKQETGQIMGFCKGCDQGQLVEANTQVEADILATKMCKCELSRPIRAEWDIVDKVQKVCDWESESLGFKKLNTDVADALIQMGKLCLHNHIIQGQVKVDDSVVTLTRKAAGVGIQRTMKVEIGEEALE